MAFNYLPARLHTLKTKCLNPDQARQIRPDHYSNNLTIIEFLRSFEPVECEIIMSGFKVVINYVLSVVIKYGVENNIIVRLSFNLCPLQLSALNYLDPDQTGQGIRPDLDSNN